MEELLSAWYTVAFGFGGGRSSEAKQRKSLTKKRSHRPSSRLGAAAAAVYLSSRYGWTYAEVEVCGRAREEDGRAEEGGRAVEGGRAEEGRRAAEGRFAGMVRRGEVGGLKRA